MPRHDSGGAFTDYLEDCWKRGSPGGWGDWGKDKGKECLFVCLFVCLLVCKKTSKKKTNKPTNKPIPYGLVGLFVCFL